MYGEACTLGAGMKLDTNWFCIPAPLPPNAREGRKPVAWLLSSPGVDSPEL